MAAQGIDDTVPLSCTILATDNSSGHVVYVMKVQRGYDPKYTWQISKRYNEFNDLYNQLKVTNYEMSLPPKKAFGNMKPEFLTTRQQGLQEFIDKILKNLQLANSLQVKKFLDEENYFQNFQEIVLQHVSMYFRSEPNWEVVEPLNQIGWRFRKQHVLLKNSENPNTKYLLTWYEHGIHKSLKENELKTIFQQFCLIQHEYIEPMIRIESGDMSTIMIQKYNDKLISLRDYIYGQTKITSNYMKKYAHQKSPPTMNHNLIKVLCKKIMLALQFIYSKGLFYGHLHTGNILIEQNGNCVKLTDLPNGILGLPYFYRSCIIDQRKIQNLELVDVYGFGHVLYEMIYGEPLLNGSSKTDFSDCKNIEIKQMLELLLTDEGIKAGLPTINQLMEMPFFKNTNIDQIPTSSVSASANTSNMSKLFSSAKVKEYLQKSREFIEKRMNEEQKALHKIKRHNNAEAKVLSEQEIRKRRKEKKKAVQNMNNSLEYPTSLSGNSTSNSAKSQTKSESKSPSSTQSKTTTSTPPAPPPPPPPSMGNGPPAPPPPPIGGAPPPPPTADRSNLLSSINSFNKGGLKKTKTNDRSDAKI